MNAVVQRLLDHIAESSGQIRRPESTYRLQFHLEFGFKDAVAILPYLRDLGITDCYASPYLKARPGSRHGYDITDHAQINPEVGGEEDHTRWVEALRQNQIGQILDIVPNHMAVVGNDNSWWNDVLENGPASPYSGYFDIAWSSSPRPELQGRVLIPILGDSYAKVLEAQQLQLTYREGAFSVNYFDHRFPIAPRSYGLILSHDLPEVEKTLGPDSEDATEYHSILTAVKHLPRSNETDPSLLAERRREKEVIKRRLTDLTQKSAPVREFIERLVAQFNGVAGVPSSFNLLEELLDDQLYRLAYWRVAADEINYRRFFDINELAALSMERDDVFAATHKLILDMLRQGVVTGLRIDHPDGLYDPLHYFERLQTEYVVDRARTAFEAMSDRGDQPWPEVEAELRQTWAEQSRRHFEGRKQQNKTVEPAAKSIEPWPLFLIVEKILTGDEKLPEEWPIFGTSGYEFLNWLNGLFVAPGEKQSFSRIYREFANEEFSLSEIIYRKKILILQIALSGELQMLSYQLDRLAQKNRRSRDFTHHSLRQALREIIACFPVYRSYITDSEDISDADRKHILQAVRRAMLANPALSTPMFHFVRDMLLLRSLGPEPDDEQYQADQRRFVGKFQQVTAPVMAKGVEDTAFYVFNRLISLNEVGGDPDRFGIAPEALHRAFAERQARWPWSFSATSTHDTKRSEDVRARINVLSEIPDEWQAALNRWSKFNAGRRTEVEETLAPDTNEEYLLYQTLLGAWPLEPCAPAVYADFVKRIQAYMRKALQEAKVHTSWINPNAAYDEAVQQFVSAILDPAQSAPFLDDFRAFQKRISHLGMINSLAQTLVKIAAPGVADFYQGMEIWDFSLVDPDNRRPVDFNLRSQMLKDIDARIKAAGDDRTGLAKELVANMADGRVKLWVTSQGLRLRRAMPGLFTTGRYEALSAAGSHQDSVFGFLRAQGDQAAVVVVPRLLWRVSGDQPPLGPDVWGDTCISLPSGLEKRQWRNVFTGRPLHLTQSSDANRCAIGEIFADFPVAILMLEPSP